MQGERGPQNCFYGFLMGLLASDLIPEKRKQWFALLEHSSLERRCGTRPVSGNAGQKPPLVLKIYFMCQHCGCTAHTLWSNSLYLLFPLWCWGWCLSVCNVVNGRFQFPCPSYVGEPLSASVGPVGDQCLRAEFQQGKVCFVELDKYEPHKCDFRKY